MSSSTDERFMQEVEEVLRDLCQFSPDSNTSASPENKFPLDENFFPASKRAESEREKEGKVDSKLSAPLCAGEEDVLFPFDEFSPQPVSSGQAKDRPGGGEVGDTRRKTDDVDRTSVRSPLVPMVQVFGDTPTQHDSPETNIARETSDGQPPAEFMERRKSGENLSSEASNDSSDKSTEERDQDACRVEKNAADDGMQTADDECGMEASTSREGEKLGLPQFGSPPSRLPATNGEGSPYENKWRETESFLNEEKTVPGETTPFDTDAADQTPPGDRTTERGTWNGRFDYVLALLGAAVGLGNVWRFPYLCYRNGGGAFLVPFLVMMALLGVPMFYLQAAIAQFSSLGPTKCWEFCRFLRGTGVAMAMFCFLASIYYNIILAWAFHFLFASFKSSLPWQCCGNEWNSANCSWGMASDSCPGAPCVNGTVELGDPENDTWAACLHGNTTEVLLVSPTTEYFNVRVLGVGGGLGEWGTPQWELVLCFLLTWVVCFCCMIKGIHTSGKVVYVTATFPFLLLLVLLVRGATLENAIDGIRYFLIPSFDKLASADVWRDATHQVFYSMAISTGCVIAFSSYNRFHYNFLRDTIVVSVGDTVTSVLAGLVIFSYLGHMAGKLDITIDQVAKSGPGLVFEVYPLAVTTLPLPQLWSVVFFITLLMLGLDTMFAGIEVVLTGILDVFPGLIPKKTLIILIICVVSFLLGLPLTGPGGVYWVDLMDQFLGGWNLIIIALGMYVAGILCYGTDRLYEDIEAMLGYRPTFVWKVFWHLLTPATLLIMLIFQFRDHHPVSMGSTPFPVWAEVTGWCLALLSFGWIPVLMVYSVATAGPGSLWQRLRRSLQPTALWRPCLPEHRRLVARVFHTSLQSLHVDPKSGSHGNQRHPENPDL